MQNDAPFFPIVQEALDHLRAADPNMKAAIDRLGPIHREIGTDLLSSLLKAVIGQQISGAASETIWNRFVAMVGTLTPENLLAHDIAALRSCGISERKAGYLRGIAAQISDRRLDLEALSTMRDEQVVEQLIRLPGIGPWTADMTLLFALCRPDVLSWADFGIRRGMSRLYGLEELDQAFFEDRRRAYTPFGSTASLYLWQLSAEPEKPVK